MNYTKIGNKNEPWNNVILEDINLYEKKVCFILADRFSVYNLRVLNSSQFHDKIIAYLIEGIKIDERAIVLLKIDLRYNMVINSKLKRSIKFDGELSNLLRMALLVKIRDTDVYYFPQNVIGQIK